MRVDCVVVGARCGGAPTAMLLADRGLRVLLLDRASFPAETVSTLYIQPFGVELLDEWKLLDDVRALGAPPITRVRHSIGDVVVEGPAPHVAGESATYAPRRSLLDGVLVDAAVRSGATFVDGARCVDVTRDATGRVTGIRYRDRSGVVTTVESALVVGADGRDSTVARLVDAPVVRSDPSATYVHYGVWSGLDTGFGFHETNGHWIATIPTNDDATIVAVYRPQSTIDEAVADLPGSYRRAVAHVLPDVAERLSPHRLREPLSGRRRQPNFFRAAAGPGWALVGDAGHHRDSITAQGIANAFRQADLLAEAYTAREPADWDAAGEAYAAARDGALLPTYEATLECARLAPTPGRIATMRFIAADDGTTARYLAAIGGVASIEDVFA